jgi:hypothetical protein
MRKLTGLTGVPAALMLSACNVQLHDTTPAAYTANHDIGMYEVSANVTRDALVAPGSVYVFALGGKRRITLSSNADGSQWRGLYEVRCQSTFPLQFLVEWRLPFNVSQALVPPQPRQVELREPPLTAAARFDTSRKAPKGGWQGAVQYRFVTAPSVRITAAHLEPATAAPADVAAVKAISVLTSLPLVAACAEPAEVRLASTAPRAHGTLVIETDHPAVPEWKTKVEFSPQ